MEVWTIWHPSYFLSGVVKAATAAVSLLTAVMLIPLIPKAISLGSLTELQATNRISDFALGERDNLDRLLIPEKLYGRDREVDTLLSAFDRIVAGGKPELVLVSGYSSMSCTSR